jgi:hypothetical protein
MYYPLLPSSMGLTHKINNNWKSKTLSAASIKKTQLRMKKYGAFKVVKKMKIILCRQFLLEVLRLKLYWPQ